MSSSHQPRFYTDRPFLVADDDRVEICALHVSDDYPLLLDVRLLVIRHSFLISMIRRRELAWP